MKDDYFVYDYIDNKRKYNIFRLENEQVNPYIRFKIVGGCHKGLSIRFSTMKGNYKIHDHKIMTEFSGSLYRQAGVAWSSDLYKLENPETAEFTAK